MADHLAGLSVDRLVVKTAAEWADYLAEQKAASTVAYLAVYLVEKWAVQWAAQMADHWAELSVGRLVV